MNGSTRPAWVLLWGLGGSGCNGPDTDLPTKACSTAATATVLTAATAPSDGPMTTARAGDVLLENDKIRVVVQGTGRSVATNPWGGNIIDADIVRPDGSFQDAFGELGTFANLAGTSSADRIDVVPNTCDHARVRVEGTYVLSDYINLKTGVASLLPGLLADADVNVLWPLHFTTDYVLYPDSSSVRVEVTVRNDGTDTVPSTVGWLIDAGMVDGVVPTADSYDLTLLGIAEFFVFDGPTVSYGVLPLAEERFVDRTYVSIVGGYSLTHDIDLASFLGFPATVPQLAPGDEMRFDVLFTVADDHASVVELLWAELGEPACTVVTGTVAEQGSGVPLAGAHVGAIEVDGGADGIDLSHTRTDADGRYEMCLPPGDVRLITGMTGRPYAGGGTTPERVPVSVGADALDVPLELPATGRITASVTDASGGPLASRVLVMGVDPSPHSHRLHGQGFDPLAPGLTAAVDAVDGVFDLPLEPGDYDVIVAHGPEYSASRVAVALAAGETVDVSTTLHRVVDTTGFVTGDFHVHAQASPDSTRSNAVRVANMVAEGVEVLVSTDHDFVTDFQPAIDELGVGALITTFPGEEITSFDYGHFNAFPLEIDPNSPNNGAVDWAGRTPTQIGEEVLAGPGPRVYQLNHPRAVPAPGAGGNYFNVIDLQFDATGPFEGPLALSTTDARLPDGASMLATNFTAMEVITWLDVQGLHDWYNFINAGHFFTATGNSDTHTQYVESSGWPRNYVFLGTDDPAAVTADTLATAINDGRNSVGFGVFLTAEATGDTTGAIGDTVAPDGAGDVTVSVRAQAPTWVPFDDVVLWDGGAGTPLVSGAVVPSTVSTGAAAEAERLEHTIQHTWQPTADTWVVAIAQGSASMFPTFPYNTGDPATVDIAAIRAGTVPGGATAFAITNPIWIDADGDGQITPSHLVLPPDFGDWRWEDRTNPY